MKLENLSLTDFSNKHQLRFQVGSELLENSAEDEKLVFNRIKAKQSMERSFFTEIKSLL